MTDLTLVEEGTGIPAYFVTERRGTTPPTWGLPWVADSIHDVLEDIAGSLEEAHILLIGPDLSFHPVRVECTDGEDACTYQVIAESGPHTGQIVEAIQYDPESDDVRATLSHTVHVHAWPNE